MKSKQTGFTLIELIVVIVILGILAATAMPKFVDFKSDAKIAALKGLAGGLESAKNLVMALFLVKGESSSKPGYVEMPNTGGEIHLISVDSTNAGYGLPAATTMGIIKAIQDLSGFQHNGSAASINIDFRLKDDKDTSACKITYDRTNGKVDTSALTKANYGK